MKRQGLPLGVSKTVLTFLLIPALMAVYRVLPNSQNPDVWLVELIVALLSGVPILLLIYFPGKPENDASHLRPIEFRSTLSEAFCYVQEVPALFFLASGSALILSYFLPRTWDFSYTNPTNSVISLLLSFIILLLISRPVHLVRLKGSFGDQSLALYTRSPSDPGGENLDAIMAKRVFYYAVRSIIYCPIYIAFCVALTWSTEICFACIMNHDPQYPDFMGLAIGMLLSVILVFLNARQVHYSVRYGQIHMIKVTPKSMINCAVLCWAILINSLGAGEVLYYFLGITHHPLIGHTPWSFINSSAVFTSIFVSALLWVPWIVPLFMTKL